MSQENLNLEYSAARLTIKAINASKHLTDAAKLLGVTPSMVYEILRRNRIIMKRDEKGVPYIEKGGTMVYRDSTGKIIKTII